MTLAGNSSGGDDDPFAYLYRSEPAKPPPTDQSTQQMPVVEAESSWSGAAGARVDAGQRYDPQGGYTGGGNTGGGQAPGYSRPRPAWLSGSGGGAGVSLGGRGPVLAALALLAVVGLGIWAAAVVFGDDAAKAGSQGASEVPGAQAPESSPTPKSSNASTTGLETAADKLELAGGAKLSTEHKGYTGAGFVTGLEQQGSQATWTVEVPEKGTYRLTVRYSNAMGSDGQQIERKIGLSANGDSFGQLRMPVIGNWDNWGTTWRQVRLSKGSNKIVIVCAPGDSCHVNIDALRLTRS